MSMQNGLPSYAKEYRFCYSCGSDKLSLRIPDGDERPRVVCDDCNAVTYFNPKVVCAVLTLTQDLSRVLLVKRTIPPVGKWTIPAGFMEMSESTASGALREAKEEANAEIDLGPVLAVYNILGASQVQIMYVGYLSNEEVSAGSESSEAVLFGWDEIPWDMLAFPTVRWGLEYARDNLSNLDRIQPQLRTKQFDGSFTAE